MRSNTYTTSDAQHTITDGASSAPLVLETPRTLAGGLVTVLLAALAMVAVLSPVLALLLAQALVIARYVGPPAVATTLQWVRSRRRLRVVPGVSPAE